MGGKIRLVSYLERIQFVFVGYSINDPILRYMMGRFSR